MGKIMQILEEKLINQDLRNREKLLSVDSIAKLVEFCVKNACLQYGNAFHGQTRGAVMGLPLSPVLADLFMEWLEDQLLTTCDDEIQTWLRYVDNTFTIIKKGELGHVLTAANAISPDIQFTVEEENNRGIAFLDVWVQISDSSLTTHVYRKPTHTGKYINSKSHHPQSTKRATLSCLAQRIESHCSTNLW
eukprot:scpid99327/ scgid21510/ 